jgi:hypothetical protein
VVQVDFQRKRAFFISVTGESSIHTIRKLRHGAAEHNWLSVPASTNELGLIHSMLVSAGEDVLGAGGELYPG